MVKNCVWESPGNAENLARSFTDNQGPETKRLGEQLRLGIPSPQCPVLQRVTQQERHFTGITPQGTSVAIMGRLPRSRRTPAARPTPAYTNIREDEHRG